MYDNIIVNEKTPKYKLIEYDLVEKEYGFLGNDLIIEDDKGQRYLMEDCFGGDDINGYSIRWSHGMIFKIKKDDTLQSLKKIAPYCNSMHWELIMCRYNDRPWLDWDGYIIQNIAKSLGV